VRGREAVDGKSLAAGFGEMKESADMIILVVTGEEPLRFGMRQSENGKSNGLAKFTGVQAIQADKFAKGHDGSAASGFGADANLLWQSVLRHRKEEKRLASKLKEYRRVRRRNVWRLTRGFGKMLGRIRMRWEE